MFWLGSQMVIRYSPSIAFYKIIYFRESGDQRHFGRGKSTSVGRTLPLGRRARYQHLLTRNRRHSGNFLRVACPHINTKCAFECLLRERAGTLAGTTLALSSNEGRP